MERMSYSSYRSRLQLSTRSPVIVSSPLSPLQPLLLRLLPIPNIPNHDTQNPTIYCEKCQPRHKKPWTESTLAQELELVCLLEPESLCGLSELLSREIDGGKESSLVCLPTGLQR